MIDDASASPATHSTNIQSTRLRGVTRCVSESKLVKTFFIAFDSPVSREPRTSLSSS